MRSTLPLSTQSPGRGVWRPGLGAQGTREGALEGGAPEGPELCPLPGRTPLVPAVLPQAPHFPTSSSPLSFLPSFPFLPSDPFPPSFAGFCSPSFHEQRVSSLAPGQHIWTKGSNLREKRHLPSPFPAAPGSLRERRGLRPRPPCSRLWARAGEMAYRAG